MYQVGKVPSNRAEQPQTRLCRCKATYKMGDILVASTVEVWWGAKRLQSDSDGRWIRQVGRLGRALTDGYLRLQRGICNHTW